MGYGDSVGAYFGQQDKTEDSYDSPCRAGERFLGISGVPVPRGPLTDMEVELKAGQLKFLIKFPEILEVLDFFE